MMYADARNVYIAYALCTLFIIISIFFFSFFVFPFVSFWTLGVLNYFWISFTQQKYFLFVYNEKELF